MKRIFIFVICFLTLFIFNPYLNINAGTINSQAGVVNTDGVNLNVRSNNSTSSKIISKLKDKSYVTILNTKGDFYYVEYQEDAFGYVHKSYVNIISSLNKIVNTNGSNLNVRYGPSTNYKQFEKIKDKDYVVILENNGSFSKVLFEGNKTGYVSNDYLKSLYTYDSIKLNIIDYKQYDSRWSYLTLGTSGKSIKQIGCLTTCMAMSESYRTKTTITPKDIRNKSSYTSDGSLYWPKEYTTSTSKNYLSIIYNKLKNNIPVMIGLKDGKGGQHWVLVTGFTGGNTLNAANFIINDPASNKTRLNEVIDNYPYFYKIAYYS